MAFILFQALQTAADFVIVLMAARKKQWFSGRGWLRKPARGRVLSVLAAFDFAADHAGQDLAASKIGRVSCRERV